MGVAYKIQLRLTIRSKFISRFRAVGISDPKKKQAQKAGPIIGPPRQNTYWWGA